MSDNTLRDELIEALKTIPYHDHRILTVLDRILPIIEAREERLRGECDEARAENVVLKAWIKAAERLAVAWIGQRDQAVVNKYDTPANHWRGRDGDELRAALRTEPTA